MPSDPFDPLVSDPPRRDDAFPAGMAAFTVPSAGARLNVICYIAAGAGPHPTALLLHGYPGNERNLDLAQALRRAGWNVLFFHYRGAWGSEGTYSLENALDDTLTLIDYAHSPAAAAQRIDGARLALVGHSVGGYLAWRAACVHPAVRRLAFVAGANMGEFGRIAAADPAATARFAADLDTTAAIRGATWRELAAHVQADPFAHDLTNYVRGLDGKDILLVGARHDTVTPVDHHHAPLADHIRARGAARLSEIILDADHVFSDRRITLARTILTWLNQA